MILLDTHALVWLAAARERLSKAPLETFESESELAISLASVQEIAYLAPAWRIRSSSAADGVTLPLTYVESREGEVPTREANSARVSPDLRTSRSISAATAARSADSVALRDREIARSNAAATP